MIEFTEAVNPRNLLVSKESVMTKWWKVILNDFGCSFILGYFCNMLKVQIQQNNDYVEEADSTQVVSIQ